MRITSVRIERFRCLYDLTVEFDDLTVLIGANGSGKSSVLRALDWFVNGGPLDPEDVSGLEEEATVSISVTFSDLSAADRAALGSYASGDTATFWRTWSRDEGEKLTGRGLAFPPFELVRVHAKMTDLRQAYAELRTREPELDLPAASSGAAARQAMEDWEAAHPDRLELATSSATHLFGFVGQPRLAGRFDYAFVPAVFNAEEQTRDARGTLLARLLEGSTADQERIDERLRALREAVGEQIGKVVAEEHGEALRDIAERVTIALRAYVEEGSVSFEPHPPEFKILPFAVDMRVADGGIETDVSRQGNGFQRALLIATLQELARVEAEGDPPGVFLAIEEPELYQHPGQARHFASVLSELAHNGGGGIQVAYATHSPYFVDPAHYERLRRFRKRRGSRPYPTAVVTAARIAGVAERLHGIADERDVTRRLDITLRRTLSEAVFAQAVLLVEGVSDAALLGGIADRDGGFDSAGIAVVPAFGKTILPAAWAILEELGIPTFTVFDADRGKAARMRTDGKREVDIENATREAVRWNRILLRLHGAPEEDWPPTRVEATYAVVGDRLEDEFEATWPAMMARARALADEAADWREKPEEWYRQAARESEGEVPEFAARVIASVRALR